MISSISAPTAIILTGLLLVLGFAVGAWVARRGWLGSIIARRRDPTPEMLQSLYHWTASVVDDIDDCREQMQTFGDKLGATPSDSAEQQRTIMAIVGKMIETNDRLQERLHAAESSLDCQARQINNYLQQARTDALTGLSNRRAFDDEIANRHAQWLRYGVKYCLVLVDVDHFKQINDTYGHTAGDAILKGIAGRIDQTMRETDIVTRYGGEEFAVLLAITSENEARMAVRRLIEAVAAVSHNYDGHSHQVTVSCGLAEALADEAVESIVKRADKALYAAKAAGRNCGYVHTGQYCEPIDPDKANQQNRVAVGVDTTLPVSREQLRQRLLEVLSS